MSAPADRPLLVISQIPPPVHGSTVMTETLLGVLRADGRRVVLVDRRFSRNVEDIGRFQFRKAIGACSLVLRLAVAIARERPASCIHFSTCRPASFLTDVALSLVLRASGVRTIHYLHTLGFRALASRGPVWRRLVRLLLAEPSLVVCLGPSLVEDVGPWVDRRRVTTIANTTDDPQTAATAAPPVGSARQLLYLSNLIPEKGVLDFVEAGVQVAQAFPDVTFAIAGASVDRPFERAVRERIASSGCHERFTWIGAVDSAEKFRLLEGSALLVFPSRYRFEAQPLTIVEAMGCGLPVIAYDVGGVKDLVSDGVTGALVRPGDVEGLAAGVTRLLSSADVLNDAGTQARRVFERDFGIDRYAERWVRLIEEVESGAFPR